MEINNISSMYQTKLQEINSKIPDNLSVKNKFSTYLENAKLNSANTENATKGVEMSETDDNIDTNKLLNSLLTYQAITNSTASLFSNNDSSNNIFPSMNNTLQQAILLKALKKDE